MTERGEPNWRDIGLEAVVSVCAAAAFLGSCALIRVYPLDRLGQISGLASLGLRWLLFGLAIVVALAVAMRAPGDRRFATTSRYACAAISGFASAFVAGGILVALHGTPWGLNAMGGDMGALATWADALDRGAKIPPMYPPWSVEVLRIYAHVMHLPTAFALKHLQILGTAAFGPVAYVSWRVLLRPTWALAIGTIAMLPLIEPYKPFPNLVLIAFVPLAIAFLDKLRGAAELTRSQIVRAGIGFGAAFGVMCLVYSGWYQWSAPGLFVAALLVFPWRSARRPATYLLALTALVFLVFTASYLYGLFFDPAGKIVDKFVYFDVKTDPMYIAMWRNDSPGPVAVWPPLGELGGVGLFTILLVVGLGIAIALGRKTTLAIGVGCMMAGAWFLRLFYAHALWQTKLVQLYPRTTALILYCLLILAGFAAYWLVERLPADHPVRGPSGVLGAVCALLLVLGSASSAITDRYMPSNTDPPSAGLFAYNAHRTNWATRPKVFKSAPIRWSRRTSLP